jgi:hypothetical protein
MEIYAYKLEDDVIDFFSADKLIMVSQAWKSSRTGKWYIHRNKTPGTQFFNKVTVFPKSGTEFELHRYGRPYGLMELTDQGTAWRFYNNVDKTKATMVRLFVEGDPDIDLYHANPGVRIETQETATRGKTVSTIHNITILNGKPYSEMKNNVDVKGIGCMWYMRRVSDLNYRQGGYIANGNFADTNRGSGRLDWCKITDDPSVPLTTDFKGNTDLEGFNTDYIFTEKDQLDSDREALALTIFHGVKQKLSPIVIPITTIL